MAFKFDLSKFKKINSDKHSTLLRHEDGHEIRLNHETLEPQHLAQVQKMKGMHEGGAPTPSPSPEPTASPKPERSYGPDPGAFDQSTEQKNLKNSGAKLKLADGGGIPAQDSQVEQDPQAPPQQSPAMEQQQPPAPANAAPDQTLAAKRQIYNNFVTAGGNAKSMPFGVVSEGAFGPNGEPPKQFNPQAWQDAENAYNRQQQTQQQAQIQAQQAALAENKSRAAAGLPPLQLPPSPSPVQQAGSPSLGVSTELPKAFQGNPDPYGTQAYSDAFGKGVNQKLAGINQQAQAEGALGQEQAGLLHKNVQTQLDAKQQYQAHYDDLDAHRQDAMKAYSEAKIDPNRYMNSKDTLQKVGSAIGLILGGMGAGLTGGQNPALEFLNRQIDRDISAQQADMGKKANLLEANMKQFGNLRDATDMTRVMQMDLMSNQLKEAAAKSMDPQAKARALQAAGDLNMQAAPIMSQIAMRKTLLGGMNQGSIPPEQVIRAIVPQSQQEAYYKELKEAQDTASFRDRMLSAFDKLSKIDTLGNRAVHAGFEPPEVRAIRDPLIAELSKGTAGRFTEADAAMLAPLLSLSGKGDSTVNTARSQLNQLAGAKMHFPMLKSVGIDPASMSQFNSQGKNQIRESAPVRSR